MEEVSGCKFTNKYFALQPLDTSFGYFCDQYTFQVGPTLSIILNTSKLVSLLVSIYVVLQIFMYLWFVVENAIRASRITRMETR